MGEFSLWRRENPASNCKRQLCCKQIPLAGSDAPNLAQEKSLQLCTSEVIRRFPKGNGGKRVSSGYNRRRRLAPRSSGKQQAGRTAVRTAPIVCPEESPQCARRRKPLPRWGLARRLRRELGLAVPWGAHTFLSVAKEKCAKESQRHGDSGKKPFIAHF